MVGFFQGLENVWDAQVDYITASLKPSPFPSVPITTTFSLGAIAILGVAAVVLLKVK